MRNAASAVLLVLGIWLAAGGVSHAAAVAEEFQVEGLISPASPKALTAALEEQLAVEVVGTGCATPRAAGRWCESSSRKAR